MTFILSHVRILSYIVMALILGLVIYTFNNALNEAAKVPGLQREVESQKALFKAQAEQCEKNKQITEKVSNDYQNNLAKLNLDLGRLRKRPATCIAVQSTSDSSGHNGSDFRQFNVRPYGISDQWLYDYAGDAERYRIQLNACQTFVKDVWASH